jgi:uncharacterized membrane protein
MSRAGWLVGSLAPGRVLAAGVVFPLADDWLFMGLDYVIGSTKLVAWPRVLILDRRILSAACKAGE